MHLKHVLLACVWLFCSLHAGSQPAEKKYTYAHPQMGTTFKITFYSRLDSISSHAIATEIFSKIDSLNLLFSDYLPESELNRLCNQAGNLNWINISSDLWNILDLSNYFTQASSGAFDVSVGAITRLWRKARAMKELPDSTLISNTLRSSGHTCVQLKPKQQARILQAGTRLDLGGIAQGYTADICLNLLRSKGIRRALVDAGGDIAIGDPPPYSNGWLIYFPSYSNDNTDHLDSLRLSNCGITTSGATTRYLEVNNIKYSHIIDPRTGWALTENYLVTVQAPNATIADAWATALNVLGPLGWELIRDEHPELNVWIIKSNH